MAYEWKCRVLVSRRYHQRYSVVPNGHISLRRARGRQHYLLSGVQKFRGEALSRVDFPKGGAPIGTKTRAQLLLGYALGARRCPATRVRTGLSEYS
jgi:hypothetical protein